MLDLHKIVLEMLDLHKIVLAGLSLIEPPGPVACIRQEQLLERGKVNEPLIDVIMQPEWALGAVSCTGVLQSGVSCR